VTDRLSSYAELAEILEILPVLLREGRRSRRLTLRAASEQTGVGFNTILRAHPNAWPPRTPRPESSHDEDLLRLRIP
jgi:hypothetical protein